MFFHFGLPEQLHYDMGSYNLSPKKYVTCCTSVKCTPHRTTLSDGLVERLNRTIQIYAYNFSQWAGQ